MEPPHAAHRSGRDGAPRPARPGGHRRIRAARRLGRRARRRRAVHDPPAARADPVGAARGDRFPRPRAVRDPPRARRRLPARHATARRGARPPRGSRARGAARGVARRAGHPGGSVRHAVPAGARGRLRGPQRDGARGAGHCGRAGGRPRGRRAPAVLGHVSQTGRTRHALVHAADRPVPPPGRLPGDWSAGSGRCGAAGCEGPHLGPAGPARSTARPHGEQAAGCARGRPDESAPSGPSPSAFAATTR